MIQSPFAWLGDQLDRAFHSVGSATDEEYWNEIRRADAVTVRRIGPAGQSIVCRPPTELFDEGSEETISFEPVHCVLL